MTETPLRTWRRATGLSIRDLERLTGINRGRLSMFERGVPVPDEDMARISEALIRHEGRSASEAPR